MDKSQKDSLTRVLEGIKGHARKMRGDRMSAAMKSMDAPAEEDEEQATTDEGQEAVEAAPQEGVSAEPDEETYPNKNPNPLGGEMGNDGNIEPSKERPLTIRVDEMTPEEIRKLIASV